MLRYWGGGGGVTNHPLGSTKDHNCIGVLKIKQGDSPQLLPPRQFERC